MSIKSILAPFTGKETDESVANAVAGIGLGEAEHAWTNSMD